MLPLISGGSFRALAFSFTLMILYGGMELIRYCLKLFNWEVKGEDFRRGKGIAKIALLLIFYLNIFIAINWVK